MASTTQINFYLNETKTKIPPLNWKEFGIELNFDKDSAGFKSQVSITDFEFVNQNADIINKWIADGLTNGVGVFEGIPFRIEIARNGIIEIPFNGYLDLTQTNSFAKHRSTIRAVEFNDIDNFSDRCYSFTFRHLYDIGIITLADFVSVPYVISSVPNYVEAAVATISVYVMVREITSAIQRILEFVAELPIYYVFSTYIKLILYIIYLILLTIALIKLVKSIVLLLIQPVKYHSAMSVKTHMEKAAEYLGMTFESPIFDNDPFKYSYIIPEKYFNPINKKEKQIFGFTTPSITQQGFYKGTFGDLLNEAKKIWNAKVIVDGTVIKLVRKDSIINPQYTMPRIANNYYNKILAYGLNTDEFRSNYLISFQIDSVDKNTMQDYQGTSYQVIVEPNRVTNQNMVLMKGLEEVRIGFALAKTKTDLTSAEKVLDLFLKIFGAIAGALITVINAIIDVLNAVIAIVNDVLAKLATIGIKLNFVLPSIPKIDPPDFSNKAKNRIGMLKIETDIIGVNRICCLDVQSQPEYTKILASNDLAFSGKFLYDNYHFVNSFLPTPEKPNANQWKKYNFEKVPFTFDDYEKVKNNNSIFVQDDKEALIDSLKWNIENQTADISIRKNELYTRNLKQTTSEPDGK